MMIAGMLSAADQGNRISLAYIVVRQAFYSLPDTHISVYVKELTYANGAIKLVWARTLDSTGPL